PKLQRAEQAIKDFAGRITQLEHETALALYVKAETESSANIGEIRSRFSTASADWKELLLRIYALKLKEPDKITLAIFGEDRNRMFELAKIYYRIATRQSGPGVKAEVWRLTSKPPAKNKKKIEREGGSLLERKKIEKPDQFFVTPGENILGIALGLNF